MSKIALIGITLISLLNISWNSLESAVTRDNSYAQIEKTYELVTTVENIGTGDDCTITTHGYAFVDGVAVYLELTVTGPCDSRLAAMVRAAIRALRGIK